MIAMAGLALAAVLALYFIYQAGRRPLFLFGIPFLQVMRESVFFSAAKPFWIPGRWGPNYNILIWMFVAWAWCVYRSREQARSTSLGPRSRSAGLLPEDCLVLALAALALGKVVWASLGPADTAPLLSQFAPWALLPVGYLLLRGAVRRSSSEDVAALLRAVAVVTGIGAVLFILHQGLQLHIYDQPEYAVFTFAGQEMSRSFWFMPPFLLLPLATGLAKWSWSVLSIALVICTLIAVVVSYTRVLFLGAVVVVVVLLAVRLWKERRGGAVLRRLSTTGAILGVAVVVLLVVVPTPTSYFVERVASLIHPSTVAEDPNVQIRQERLVTLEEAVSDRYGLAGAPFGVSDDLSPDIYSWTSDSTWVGVLYWTGFAGIALIGAMFVLFVLRAFKLFLRSTGTREFLGAVFLALLVAMLATTFASWTFLQPWSYAMGFWLFALIAGEAGKRTEVGEVEDSMRCHGTSP